MYTQNKNTCVFFVYFYQRSRQTSSIRYSYTVAIANLQYTASPNIWNANGEWFSSLSNRHRRMLHWASYLWQAWRLDIPINPVEAVDYVGQINYRSHSTGSRPTNSLLWSYRLVMTSPSNMPRRQAAECGALRRKQTVPALRAAAGTQWKTYHSQHIENSWHSNIYTHG